MNLDFRKLSRFIFFGVINSTLTYVLYMLLELFLPTEIAYTLAFVSGIGLSYVLNALFVFRVQLSWKAALHFPFIYVIQYIVGLGLLSALLKIGMKGPLAVLCVMAMNVPLTFVLTRFVLVRRMDQKSVE